MTLEEFLRDNEKLCEAATPGPFLLEQCYDGRRTVAQIRSPDTLLCVNSDGKPAGFENEWANGRFFAAARQSLPLALKILQAWQRLAIDTPTELCGSLERAAERILREVP